MLFEVSEEVVTLSFACIRILLTRKKVVLVPEIPEE